MQSLGEKNTEGNDIYGDISHFVMTSYLSYLINIRYIKGPVPNWACLLLQYLVQT